MFGHFIRIWGRTPGELSLEVRDPVGEGFMHGRTASSMTKSVEHEGSAKPKKGQAELHPKLLRIRPAFAGAHTAIDRVRRENADWLQPWDATLPPDTYGNEGQTLGEYRRTIDRAQRAGRALVMKLEIGGEIAGQFSLTNVTHGAMSSGMLGYWLAEKWAGRGLATFTCAAIIDLVIGELGLHRVEVVIRPENSASLGVARKLGLHREGLRPRYMHIDGAWADHEAFSIDTESLPSGGLVKSIYGHAIGQ